MSTSLLFVVYRFIAYSSVKTKTNNRQALITPLVEVALHIIVHIYICIFFLKCRVSLDSSGVY